MLPSKSRISHDVSVPHTSKISLSWNRLVSGQSSVGALDVFVAGGKMGAEDVAGGKVGAAGAVGGEVGTGDVVGGEVGEGVRSLKSQISAA